MNSKDPTSLPFESSDPEEQKLWSALSDLPLEEPSSQLRRRFYNGLHDASRPAWYQRLGQWLGMRSSNGWATVAACLVIGFGVAQLTDSPVTESTRLVALEDNVAMLQRELILDRLQDTSAATRLRGVVDASRVAASDPLVVQALLDRATQDRSVSVRSAAIDALGPQISSGEVGAEVMQLLQDVDSPIVQFALVDLVLRQGSAEQIRHLQDLADKGELHPDLARHVNNALRSQSI